MPRHSSNKGSCLVNKREWTSSGLVILVLLIVSILVAQSCRNCEIPGSSLVPCIWGEPLKRYQGAITDRRFPPPWTVEKILPGLLGAEAK